MVKELGSHENELDMLPLASTRVIGMMRLAECFDVGNLLGEWGL